MCPWCRAGKVTDPASKRGVLSVARLAFGPRLLVRSTSNRGPNARRATLRTPRLLAGSVTLPALHHGHIAGFRRGPDFAVADEVAADKMRPALHLDRKSVV